MSSLSRSGKNYTSIAMSTYVFVQTMFEKEKVETMSNVSTSYTVNQGDLYVIEMI